MKTRRIQSVIRNTMSAGILAIAIATSALIGGAGDVSARTNELRMERASASGVLVATSTTPAGESSYLRHRTGFQSE